MFGNTGGGRELGRDGGRVGCGEMGEWGRGWATQEGGWGRVDEGCGLERAGCWAVGSGTGNVRGAICK